MANEKIALFVPSLRGGGAERVMLNLACGLAERGFKVDLVLAKAEGPYLSEVAPGVRIVDFNARRVLYSLPQLMRYLRVDRPQALLSTLSHANIVAIWARMVTRVPVRLVIREANTPSPDAKGASTTRGRLMPAFMRLFYHYADAIVAVSWGVAEDLKKTTGVSDSKLRVIYNPVNTPELFKKASEELNHPWFLPAKPPVVLGVGRLTAQKDFATLIRAFALVRKERLARLMILGEGVERSGLEALVRELGLEEDVVLPGFVENPYKYMKRAAVFVLSSQWEGFPNVLIEAMTLGTPVISTDCPSGSSEILEGGRWGRLIPVEDSEAMAQAIVQVLETPHEQLPNVRERARDFEQKYAIDAYLQVFGLSPYPQKG